MPDDRIQALVSSLLERVHLQMQRDLAGLADDVRAHIGEERRAAADAARAHAESAAAVLVSSAIAAERAAFDDRLALAREEARNEAVAAERATFDERLADAREEERAAFDGRLAAAREDARAETLADVRAEEWQADLARADRLLISVRALDEATSLSEALDVLARAASDEAGRAAVLLVRGDELRGWAHAGFASSFADARSISIPLSDAGLFGVTIAEGAPASTGEGSDIPSAPAPFTLSDPDRTGIAVPVVVDGRVVAVVYADDGGEAAREVPSTWPEHIELLARHASRCLEALTARQTSRPRVDGHATGAEPSHDEESARRYARLLVSEIKLYHEAVLDEARKQRDIRSRLGSQIARARGLYEERVPTTIRSHRDYFELELIRTLADGDASLLGRAS